MKIKTINDLLSYVETEEKAQRLINYINSLEELREIDRLKQDNEYLNKVNIELSTEKNRLNNILNELEKEIDNFDVFKEFSFPLMKRWEEEQVKSSIDYEWRKAIKEPFLNKIKELKGDGSNE